MEQEREILRGVQTYIQAGKQKERKTEWRRMIEKEKRKSANRRWRKEMRKRKEQRDRK